MVFTRGSRFVGGMMVRATSGHMILMSPDGGQEVNGSYWPAHCDPMLQYQRNLWGQCRALSSLRLASSWRLSPGNLSEKNSVS